MSLLSHHQPDLKQGVSERVKKRQDKAKLLSFYTKLLLFHFSIFINIHKYTSGICAKILQYSFAFQPRLHLNEELTRLHKDAFPPFLQRANPLKLICAKVSE